MVRQVDAFISRSRFFFFFMPLTECEEECIQGMEGVWHVVYLLTDRVKEAKKTV